MNRLTPSMLRRNRSTKIFSIKDFDEFDSTTNKDDSIRLTSRSSEFKYLKSYLKSISKKKLNVTGTNLKCFLHSIYFIR